MGPERSPDVRGLGMHQLRHVAAHRGGRVEAGIKRGHDHVEVQHRLPEKRQLRGRPQPSVCGPAGQLHQRPANVEFVEWRRRERRHQVGDRCGELHVVVVIRCSAEILRGPHHVVEPIGEHS